MTRYDALLNDLMAAYDAAHPQPEGDDAGTARALMDEREADILARRFAIDACAACAGNGGPWRACETHVRDGRASAESFQSRYDALTARQSIRIRRAEFFSGLVKALTANGVTP